MSVSLWSTVLVTAVLVAVVGGAAGGVVLAEVRAQDAADAAALAAAHAQRRGTDPAAAAERAATAAGGRVTSCDCAGPTVPVEVSVPVPVRAAHLTGVTSRQATAASRLVPTASGAG